MLETLLEDTISKHNFLVKSDLNLNLTQKIKLRLMNRKPAIQLVKTSDLALHILFPKVQTIHSKGMIFQKTPTRPPTLNFLIWNSSVLEHSTQKIDWAFKSMIHLYLLIQSSSLGSGSNAYFWRGSFPSAKLVKKTDFYRQSFWKLKMTALSRHLWKYKNDVKVAMCW